MLETFLLILMLALTATVAGYYFFIFLWSLGCIRKWFKERIQNK